MKRHNERIKKLESHKAESGGVIVVWDNGEPNGQKVKVGDKEMSLEEARRLFSEDEYFWIYLTREKMDRKPEGN